MDHDKSPHRADTRDDEKNHPPPLPGAVTTNTFRNR